MSFTVLQPNLRSELNELLTHYPEKRSASLMFLHAIQERFGCITPEAMEWTAARLGLQPINIYELVTFYPDVPPDAGGQAPDQGLPDLELRVGRQP